MARSASSPSPVRAERLATLGKLADATVTLDGDDLAGRIGAACGRPPTLVIDALWGDAGGGGDGGGRRHGARIVQRRRLGRRRRRRFRRRPVRGKQLDVLGYSNFGIARAGVRRRLPAARRAGQSTGSIPIDVERFALADVAAAWDATASGRRKAVVCPRSWHVGG